jgi:hypothetical protein
VTASESSVGGPGLPGAEPTLGDVIQRPGSATMSASSSAASRCCWRISAWSAAGRSRGAALEGAARERIAQQRGKTDYSSTLDPPAEIVVLEGTEEAVETAVLLCRDEGVSYIQNEDAWEEELASVEWEIVVEALAERRRWRACRVQQPVIAEDFKNTAVVAVFLSLLLILIYIWVRFGSVRYSMAAIVDADARRAVRDRADRDGGDPVRQRHHGGDRPIAADRAVQDRPEPRRGDPDDHRLLAQRHDHHHGPHPREPGALPYATKKVVNDSINQTISRTIITSGTTLIATLILY